MRIAGMTGYCSLQIEGDETKIGDGVQVDIHRTMQVTA